MIYTEIESHRASFRERLSVIHLVWRSTRSPAVSRRSRRRALLLTLRIYANPTARVSSYIVNKNGLAP